MIHFECKSHRWSLKAESAEAQKVFLMLKLLPGKDIAQARPPLALVLVIDTSGSMSGAKLDRAIEASHRLINDNRLRPDDQISIIHFNDDSDYLLKLRSIGDKAEAHGAVDALRNYSGGTMMALGMDKALAEVKTVPTQTAKRVLLFTDGQTADEDRCRMIAPEFGKLNAPIIAAGVGDDYNEDLLKETAAASLGRPYHLKTMEDLDGVLEAELGSSVREVVTDIRANVGAVKGVSLDSLTRVYPSLSEVGIQEKPYKLGNAASGDYTVFVFECSVSGLMRPPSRVRLLQVQLTAELPGLGRREEFSPQDVFVQFTKDEAAIAAVDPEVLGYVQQKNVDRMVQDAVRLSTVDAGRSRQTLQAAIGVTQRLGNSAVTRMLENALNELNQSGTISAGTRKTVALGGRTKTIKTGAPDGLSGVPSADEIRKMTGA